MVRSIPLLALLALAAAGGAHAEPPPPSLQEPHGPLPLATALALALLHNPTLAADQRAVRANEAEALQAGLLPNPFARVELEDVGADAPFDGVDQAQATFSLGSLIELGGKRAARVRLAKLGTELAAWDYERRRMDVLSATAQAFIEVLAQQQHLALAEEMIALTEGVAARAQRRFEAGAAPARDRTRAEIAQAAARIEAAQAGRALAGARQQLAAQWGARRPGFARAEGSLDLVRPLPSLDQLEQRVARNPDLARWASEIAQRDATLALERSQAVPNVTVEAGYRRLVGPDGNTFVAEVWLPLPVFDRNQGAVLAAQRRLEQARDQHLAAEAGVRAALAEAYAALAAAHDEIRLLDAEILPKAGEVFAAVGRAIAQGRTDQLEVLDAQRVVIAARQQRLRALASYHQALVRVERLVGDLAGGDGVVAADEANAAAAAGSPHPASSADEYGREP